MENEHLSNKVWKNPAHSFRYKSSKMQHEFNTTIVSHLEAIACLIKSSSSQRSVKSIYKTIADLETRSKIIKMADKSPAD